MFTDSSSGRQLAMRQGTGKVKHLAGKVLWIQDCVRNGDVELSQIPTIWNVSDIGTKSLGVQRVHLLLHELNMASSTDFCIVGGPEYETQCQRHGGGRKMSKLVKQITRILVLMGLESSTLQSVAAVTMLDDDALSNTGACSGEPNTSSSGGDGFSFFIKFIFIAAFVGLLVFLWKTYRLARDAYQSFEQNYTDLAPWKVWWIAKVKKFKPYKLNSTPMVSSTVDFVRDSMNCRVTSRWCQTQMNKSILDWCSWEDTLLSDLCRRMTGGICMRLSGQILWQEGQWDQKDSWRRSGSKTKDKPTEKIQI